MTTQSTIGACIRRLRDKAGLTLETLAARANISYQYLSGIETGKNNFTVQVLDNLAAALSISFKTLMATAFEDLNTAEPPLVNTKFFRRHTPLPDGLTIAQIEVALNHTQEIIHRINQNMQREGRATLQSLIQGNNFSGLVSNILSNSFDAHTLYKHNHHQRYPDLVNSNANGGAGEGLEIKTTINIGKGGESHNGHSGWHLIACYNFTDGGDIRFVHIMFARLNSHQHEQPDWKYVGSQVNLATGSRRTETFNTTPAGTTKLRDGSVFLDTTKVDFSRWRQDKSRAVPGYSIWAPTNATRPTAQGQRRKVGHGPAVKD